MISVSMRALAVALVLAATAQFANAQWNANQKSEFAQGCISSCQRNDKVPADQKTKCVDYCACVAEGGERVAPNYDRLNSDFIANKDTDEVKAFRGLVPGCNARAFAR